MSTSLLLGLVGVAAHAQETAAPRWPCGCAPARLLTLTHPRQCGADVRELQDHLNGLGFKSGPLDGIYGPQTAAAVGEFQRRGCLRPDGVIRPSAWAALGDNGARHISLSLRGESRIAIVIDVHLALLILFDRGGIAATFPVALGKPGSPTPLGHYRVIEKASWGGGFGSRWLGLDVPWGIYGIHGTNRPWTIGGYMSKGCIRMFNSDVERIYEVVVIGTPVNIIGDPFYGTDALGPGDIGAPVAYLQRRLRQLGFYPGPADGYYQLGTEKAVTAFQRARNLPSTGQIGPEEIAALRLRPTD